MMTPEQLAGIEGQLPQLEAVAALYSTSTGANEPGRIMAEMVQDWTPAITALIAELKRCQAVIAAVRRLPRNLHPATNVPFVYDHAIRAALAGPTTESGE